MTRIKELEAKEMTQRNDVISSSNAKEMRNKTNHLSLVCNESHSNGVNITLYYFFMRHPPVSSKRQEKITRVKDSIESAEKQNESVNRLICAVNLDRVS